MCIKCPGTCNNTVPKTDTFLNLDNLINGSKGLMKQA